MKKFHIIFSAYLLCSAYFTDAQVVTTLAGGFNFPSGVVVLGANLYVSNTDNMQIDKVAISTGTKTLYAGSTSATSGNSIGTGTAAAFWFPAGMCTDGTNIYLADADNYAIRGVVASSALVSTLATVKGYPNGVATDGTNIYVADQGRAQIDMITISTGVVTLLAGSPSGITGSANGTGTAASFNAPDDIVLYGPDTLFVADASNHCIRKIVISTGVVTTYTGSSYGSNNGTLTVATFGNPTGLALDGFGNMFVADAGNNEIRKIVLATGMVSTYAGSTTAGNTNGTGTAASFNYPIAVATDASGNVYVADYRNNEIRKISQSATGIDEVTKKNEMSIYPNPNNGKFTIQITNTNESLANKELEVYNILGEKVFSTTLGLPLEGGFTIDLSNQTAGIYLYKLVKENEELIGEGKLIIQK